MPPPPSQPVGRWRLQPPKWRPPGPSGPAGSPPVAAPSPVAGAGPARRPRRPRPGPPALAPRPVPGAAPRRARRHSGPAPCPLPPPPGRHPGQRRRSAAAAPHSPALPGLCAACTAASACATAAAVVSLATTHSTCPRLTGLSLLDGARYDAARHLAGDLDGARLDQAADPQVATGRPPCLHLAYHHGRHDAEDDDRQGDAQGLGGAMALRGASLMAQLLPLATTEVSSLCAS